MAVLYPSDAWIKELQRVCNEDPEFKAMCGKFSAKFIFQVEADQNLGEPAYLYFWPHLGEVKEAMAIPSLEDKPDVTYVLAGKYTNWKHLIQGKLEPMRMISTRKLRLAKGSQLKLLQNVKLNLRIMNNATRVVSEYVDEKA